MALGSVHPGVSTSGLGWSSIELKRYRILHVSSAQIELCGVGDFSTAQEGANPIPECRIVSVLKRVKGAIYFLSLTADSSPTAPASAVSALLAARACSVTISGRGRNVNL